MKDADRVTTTADRAKNPLPRQNYFGWLMFGLSGVLFLIGGIRAGDWITVAASILWIVGCIGFVYKVD